MEHSKAESFLSANNDIFLACVDFLKENIIGTGLARALESHFHKIASSKAVRLLWNQVNI